MTSPTNITTCGVHYLHFVDKQSASTDAIDVHAAQLVDGSG